jgi:hypothetical protein
MARDARAFFPKRFFRNLYNDFLAGLQHFGNELRAAVLFVSRVAVVLRRMIGTSARAASSALGAASAAHGPLEPGTRLPGDTRARGRLRLARMLRLRRSVVEFLMNFSMSLAVFLRELFPVFAFVRLQALVHVTFGVFFFVALFVAFLATFAGKESR